MHLESINFDRVYGGLVMERLSLGQTDIILAALAASRGAAHSPVQMQKLLFLLDKRLANELGGPHFNFIPHHYGPFDRTIYDLLEQLATQ